MKSFEAKPDTALRSVLLSAMFHKGIAGPNYNLDDVSAHVTINESSYGISFWDMSCSVREGDNGYDEIKACLEDMQAA